MRSDGLRRSLFLGTRDLHDTLDARVGQFSAHEDYSSYLLGTFQFRRAIEPALEGCEYAPLVLLDALECDLVDLGLSIPAALPPASLETHAARVAALYVTEGSALGARLILRKAVELGFTAQFGARHLVRQTIGRERWPEFLDWLEGAEVNHELATAEARRIFRLALRAYRVDA